MGQVLLAELTLNVPGTVVTPITIGACSGREYRGANAPRDYPPRVVEFLNFRRDAVGDGRTFGSSSFGGGTLRLANPDGFYDALIDYGAAGGAARFLLLSSEKADYTTAVELLTCVIDQLQFSFSEVTVLLKDRRAETEVPFETTLFAGTNVGASGLEGLPDTLKDQPKPNALGYVFQAPLPWANEQALILQADRVRISAVADVYDGLVALSTGSARASIAALQSGTPAPGFYDYYLGSGGDGAYIKVPSTPVYTITADLQGQARNGTFRSTPADLFLEVLTQRAGVDSEDVSADDLDDLATVAPYDLGLWIDQPMTVREVCDRIAASIPGWWGVDKAGVYRLKPLRDPSLGTSAVTFKVIKPTGIAKATDGDIVAIERLATNDAGNGVPTWQVTVRYKEFGQVTDQAFDVNASLELRNAARKQWRSSVVSDSAVKDLHPLAVALEFETALVNESDAQSVAAQLLSLYGARRDRYRVSVQLNAALAENIDLGSIVSLKFDHFDLAAGKNFVVLGMRYRSLSESTVGSIVELDIWG
jgi:hypothetical protein